MDEEITRTVARQPSPQPATQSSVNNNPRLIVRIRTGLNAGYTQVKQSFQSDSDPDYVGFRRNPTKPGRDSIGLYAVPVVSD
jgi:hypothetical protein